MNLVTETKLKAIASAYFDEIKDPIKRHEIEMMFQAFKARIMLETKVDGYSNQGVVGGSLEPKD
jgi:dynactin complex subunit